MNKPMIKIQNLKNPLWQWVILLIVIFIAGAWLRFYRLGEIPTGFTWDEAAIGYNGWSIFETKRDEWLQRLPISFRSFGDYKAPAGIYLAGLFTQFFGLTVFAVRLPFALFGVLSLLAIAWFSYEWQQSTNHPHLKNFRSLIRFKDLPKDIQTKVVASVVMATSLLAFSPWHLHFSRAAFEAGLALFWYLIGLAAWFRLLRLQKISWLLLSITAFTISLYSYHSTKIVVPLLGLFLLIQSFHFWKKNLRFFAIGSIWGLLLLMPLIYDSVWRAGASRLNQTTILSQPAPVFEKVQLFLSNFCAHLSPQFLVLGEVSDYRQGMGQWGVLMPISYLFLIGFVGSLVVRFIMKQKRGGRHELISPKLHLPLILVVVGIVPAALGADSVPHSIRSLLALPGFILLITVICADFLRWLEATTFNRKARGNHGEKNIVIKAAIGVIVLVYLLNILAMQYEYFSTFASRSTPDFQDGYFTVLSYLSSPEFKQLAGHREKIVFSDRYGQPYIYALFFNHISPYEYHNGYFINHEFKTVNVGDLERSNAIIIATPQDEGLWPERSVKQFKGADGSIRFMLFLTSEKPVVELET